MEYRRLGRTGLQVSALGIGSWQLSGPLQIDGQADGFLDIGVAEAVTLIRTCGDLGINLIDTAEIYGNGEGERRIGSAIQGDRDRWIISSKFGLRVSSQGERIQNCSPATIRSSLEGSLKRLQTDYIDLYLYHCPPKSEHIVVGAEVLNQLKSEGKIRFYGISSDNFSEVRALVDHQSVDVLLLGRSLIQEPSELLALAQNHHLGLMTRGAFAGGLLSGQYFQEKPKFPRQDFRHGLKMRWNQHASYAKLVPQEMSMPTFALRYLLDQPETQTIILGSNTLEQYQEAIAVLSMPPIEAKLHRRIQQMRRNQALKNIPRRALRKLGVPLAY